VVVVETALPDYRVRFFELLSQRLGSRLLVIAGPEHFAPGVRSVDAFPYVRAENRFLLGRRLLWQRGVLGAAVPADVAVLPINPRILTTWITLLARHMRGRRTVLWGHAWPRRGRESGSDRLRGIMRRLASNLVVYTEKEVRELRERTPTLDVVAAPNALYLERELDPEPYSRPPHDFVCVGRLTPAKKPGLLLEAFRLAAPDLPPDVQLAFVGDGELRNELEARANGSGLSERIRFLGHISDVRELAFVYSDAIAAVSPGYVGLSLTQTLGFGVPMLIARDEPHAPEIEAALEGINCVFFESDSPPALSAALVEIAREREEWLARRESIAELVRSRYTIEGMVASFLRALRLDDELVSASQNSST
jgi:glycosyltransferase involved in cell wall biosynthesis